MSEVTKVNEAEMKSIGCKIPVELYWKFKQASAARKESTTTAIENAIKLYLDVEGNN